MTDTPIFPDRAFQRLDETDDGLFYAQPRLVVHIDDRAIAAVRRYLGAELPQTGVALDLMSSWRSHMPEDGRELEVVGLGMNDVEMRENPQLSRRVVHDLNDNSRLPFEDESFDAAVVTVSVQYMKRPVEAFADVLRLLRDGGRFHVIYSNRMFPTKAVAVWRSLDDRDRARLIGAYFQASGDWEDLTARDISPPSPPYSDPVYAVSARKPAR